MPQLYKKEIYTEECVNAKNILKLCFKNRLIRNDLINNIESFLLEYAVGFARFNHNQIKLNNVGECYIRFYSKYGESTIFNDKLQKVRNTPNHKTIDLKNLKKILKRYDIDDEYDYYCIAENIDNLFDINHYVLDLKTNTYTIRKSENSFQLGIEDCIDDNTKEPLKSSADVISSFLDCNYCSKKGKYDFKRGRIRNIKNIIYIEIDRENRENRDLIISQNMILQQDNMLIRLELVGLTIRYGKSGSTLIMKESDGNYYHFYKNTIYRIYDEDFETYEPILRNTKTLYYKPHLLQKL